MKIAFVLHGLSGGKTSKDEKLPYDSVEAIPFIKKNIVDGNDVDFFFHTWEEGFNTKFIDEYKPKKFLIEKQKIFRKPDFFEYKDFIKKTIKNLIGFYVKKELNYHNAIYSRWYSCKKSLELLENYVNNNNTKYDFVICTRFDFFLKKKIIFENLNNNFFYVPIEIMFTNKDKMPVYPASDYLKDHFDPSKYNPVECGHDRLPQFGMNDLFQMSSYENILKIKNIFDLVDKYYAEKVPDSNHHLLLAHLVRSGLEPKIVNLLKNRLDCGLIKWTKNNYKHT